MMAVRRIGDFEVVNIVEFYGPTHDPEQTFPGFDFAMLPAEDAAVSAEFWRPSVRRLVIAIQLWIVKAHGAVVLIDTGYGNGKNRTTARAHRLNTLVPYWLEAAGASFNQVTHVVCTHLHSDHVGWNTSWDGNGWRPSFPAARYYIPRADFDHFQDRETRAPAQDGGSFLDSVLPVAEAGLVDFIDPGQEIVAGLKVVSAPGHTPGMINLWLSSSGEQGVFCADVLHHPLQIVWPNLNTRFCVMPEQAVATRRRVLNEAATTGALVMPCHFAPPHCGYVRRRGEHFIFEPEPSGRRL